MYCLLILLAIGIVNTQHSCPEHELIQNFDWDFYTSQHWYEVERYDNGWDDDQDCLSVNHDKRGDMITYNITGTKDHKLIHTYGHIEPDEHVGTVIYYADIFIASVGVNFIKVNITFMNSNFAVAHHCSYTETDVQEFVWVFSLEKNVSADNKKDLQQYFNAVGFDRSKFVTVNQTEEACSNY